MAMWDQARSAISMFGATVTGLEIINTLARGNEGRTDLRERLVTISAVVTVLIEGFQGRMPSADINTALSTLRGDLANADWTPDRMIVERFRGVL